MSHSSFVEQARQESPTNMQIMTRIPYIKNLYPK